MTVADSELRTVWAKARAILAGSPSSAPIAQPSESINRRLISWTVDLGRSSNRSSAAYRARRSARERRSIVGYDSKNSPRIPAGRRQSIVTGLELCAKWSGRALGCGDFEGFGRAFGNQWPY